MPHLRHFIRATLLFATALPVLALEPGPQSPSPLEIGAVVEKTLPAGDAHAYAVKLGRGERVQVVLDRTDAPVYLKVFTMAGVLLTKRAARAEGPSDVRRLAAYDAAKVTAPFFAEFEAIYRIEIRSVAAEFPDFPTDFPATTYRLTVERSPPEHSAHEQETLAAVESWAKTAAHPLNSITPGARFDDLRPLRTILRAARVVGLGEATHGSREFFQVKHRLLEYLVRELGFTHFAMEIDQGAAEKINAYVVAGTGDAAALLREQGMWQWQTAEVDALIRWMRAYNASVPPARRVQFVGFDFQISDRAYTAFIAFLRRVAPDRLAAAESTLATTVRRPDPARPAYFEYYAQPAGRKLQIVAGVTELLGFMTLHERHFVSATSQADYDVALQGLRRLGQFVDTHSRSSYEYDVAESGVASRDRYMAENVMAMLENAGPGARIALWSANGHVRRDPYRMGYYLGRAYGTGYYAFGLEFDRGGFRALDVAAKPPVLKNFNVLPAYQGSLGWLLTRTGKGSAFIDFRGAPSTGLVAEWLHLPRLTRGIGNGYSAESLSDYTGQPMTPGVSVDGLIFVERVSAAEPMGAVKP
jgi:erythromycin esterase